MVRRTELSSGFFSLWGHVDGTMLVPVLPETGRSRFRRAGLEGLGEVLGTITMPIQDSGIHGALAVP